MSSPLAVAQSLIREGTKAVPQLRFALGVGAIVGLISIVVSIFRLDLRVALFGVVLMLVLMSLVVVFARVAALTGGLVVPALVMTWFSMIMMIASLTLLFTSVFWAKPLNLSCWLDKNRCAPPQPESLRTPEENQVIALQDKIATLRQYLLSLNDYPDSREKLSEAKDLADSITAFSDEHLNPTRRYNKRQYGGLAYVMAAAAEDKNPKISAKYTTTAVRYFDEDISMLQDAKSKYASDSDAQLLIDWVRHDNGENRVKYFKTEALCLQARVTHDKKLIPKALDTWNEIQVAYREKYPAAGTAELRGCIVPDKK